MSNFKPRIYQEQISNQAYKILNTLNIVVLAMEVRCGKTLTALMTCEKSKCKSVLFVTKKKAILSIKKDITIFNPSYSIEVINYESIHKINNQNPDIIIVDESHSLGAFPKPSKRTKDLKHIVGNKRLILMSGTITPESFSQIYHQFWISNFSPFKESSFYKWAHNFVNIRKTYVAHGNQVNDYSDANSKLIDTYTSKYIITFTQKEAGFTTNVVEKILHVPMRDKTYRIANQLEKDLVITGKRGGVILADTGVKLMQKLHQIYSGTVKLEDGSAIILDPSKANFIKQYFNKEKIAIFYKFKQELELLKEVFKDNLCTDLETFNNTSKNIALQIVSGREGVKLSKADYIVFYNIDFSSTSYFQAKDRMSTMERLKNVVYWIFSEGGIEDQIYKTVINKKNFTYKYFDRTAISKQVNKVA